MIEHAVDRAPGGRQGSLLEIGTPLRETVFVVVDLETTGGSTRDCEITEIGAVKVRGGEVLGEFATLVNPRTAVPPFVAVLTGITDAMVATAPTLASVLPTFLEWVGSSVLVAHNAPFDLGFLRTGCARLGLGWPAFESLDTARLARRILTRDEAPDCKLASLARVFRAATTPSHRALADARATVDVLHGLIGRVGGLGVHTLEELRAFCAMVTPEQRRKRHLADRLPHSPGVYMFRAGDGRILYVGKSHDVASRVRRYFVASEPRTRMAEMVAVAESVDHVPCAHKLEAEVRELRLIAEHKPPYNRRSRFPERSCWITLTREPFPRLATVRRYPGDTAPHIGPFGSARAAELARLAVSEAFELRQCGARLSLRSAGPGGPVRPCVLAELGRCAAPCDGRIDPHGYRHVTRAVAAACTDDAAPVVAAGLRKAAALAAQQRYEDAATHRDRVLAFVRGAARAQRLSSLRRCRLVAAAPRSDGGFDLAVVAAGRLVASAVIPAGAAAQPYLGAVLRTAETVVDLPPPGVPVGLAATPEESELILRWLARPGTRLAAVRGSWHSPVAGAERWLARLPGPAAALDPAARSDPFADRRGLRPARIR